MADKFIKSELGRIFKQIAKWKGFVIRSWHIGDEHIHLVMDIPPKYTIVEVVQKMKANTNRELRKKFKFPNRVFHKGNMWSAGYFVSTVGLNEE